MRRRATHLEGLGRTVPHQGNATIYQADYTYKGSNCRIKVVVIYEQLRWEVEAGWPEKGIITIRAWKL
jgi:hypothetical protein